MRYREYGRTGVRVSALGCGALHLPEVNGQIDMERPIEVFRHALDLGVNYVDTAAAYSDGLNETVLGRALQGRRDQVYIATKNDYRGESGDEWQAVLEGSLRRLDVSYIDFYHLHALTWETFQRQSGPGKPFARCRQAQTQGLIRHICFSSHDEPANIRRLIDTGEFAGMLVQYNLLDRRNEEVIAYAHERGMGVAIMGPVGGGRLAAPSERIRGLVGGARSTPEIALRFVLSNPNVTLALSGMSTMEMVDENVATAAREEPLSEAERESILAALAETQKLLDLYCTGCKYCMPCPNDVDIPANFAAMNYHRVWGLTEHARSLYRALGEQKQPDGTVLARWAEACLECGVCEDKCPQNLPIRERLQETAQALG